MFPKKISLYHYSICVICDISGLVLVYNDLMNAVAEITERRLDGSAWLRPQPWLAPAPGQYVLASPLDLPSTLPEPLFLSELGKETWLADSLPPAWQPGMRLALRGPLGHGFILPPAARRVGLAALDVPAARLLPLAELALQQELAVALIAPQIPPDLPSALEVLPMDALPELVAWADTLALDLPLASLEGLRGRLGLDPAARPTANIELLVRVPMPCGGVGECGLCAVPVKKGWKHACTAGPVFDFDELF